jgi:hypothetical protein
VVHFPERLTDDQIREGSRLADALIRTARGYANRRAVTDKSEAPMRIRNHALSDVTVGGLKLGPAQLELRQDILEHDILGLRSWRVYGSFDGASAMSDDDTAVATLEGGRVVSGRVLLANQRISSDQFGTRSDYEYLGTGPLTGTVDSDW